MDKYNNIFEYIINDNLNEKNWYNLSSNQCITWKIIEKYLDKPWNWKRLSRNPNITFNIIKNNLNLHWDWKELSISPNSIHWDKCDEYELYQVYITWDDVKNNLHLPWDWSILGNEKQMCYDLINNNNTDKSWLNDNIYKQLLQTSDPSYYILKSKLYLLSDDDEDIWKQISKSENISWYIVSNNLDKPWDWAQLTKHPNIYPETIYNNLDKPWKKEYIIYNPNITLEFLIKFGINKFDNYYYSILAMSGNSNLEMEKTKFFKKFSDNCLEEFIQKSCHPNRLLSWNDEILLEYSSSDKDSEYYIYYKNYCNECNNKYNNVVKYDIVVIID